MAETPLDLPRPPAAAWQPYLEPALRHIGWFGCFLVLAPIIGPRGYGMFILALSGIAIAEGLLSETAIGALVGLTALEERHISTALVTMIVAGTALTLMLHALAGPIGAMVDEAVVGDTFQSLTLLPLLGALAVVPTAILRRDGRQAPFIAATVCGLALGGGTAIALAWVGAGPWSLVAQVVVQRFVECAVLWTMAGERIGIYWSRRHFVELFGNLQFRSLGAALPTVARYAPCLLVGLSLGPTATGLYMLASCLAEALRDIIAVPPVSRWIGGPADAVRRACRVLLPAALGSALLPVAAPPLLDVRWWGAIRPAQILLVAAIPAAIAIVRTACVEEGPRGACWRATQVLGGLALVAVVVPRGLVAVAAALLTQAAATGIASLWPIWRRLGGQWRPVLAAAARPCAGAAAGAILLWALADPIARLLDPLSATCLLTASVWLTYLVIRGTPSGEGQPAIPRRARLGRPTPA
jgi:hypothetical protein